MMKHIIFTSALVLASAVTGEAMAVCNGSAPYTIAVTDATVLFSNKTICATGNGDQWHEYHNPTGNVLEKIGDGTAADPNVAVGSWSTANDGPPAHISYAYTGDGASPYNYAVYTDGSGGVELCGAIRATGTLSSGKVLTAC